MEIKLLLPENGAEVPLQTNLQQAFARCSGLKELKKLIKPFLKKGNNDADSDPERTKPLPVEFEWSGDGGEFTLEVSADAGFCDALKVKTTEKTAKIHNLEPGVKYYWRVNSSPAGSFVTLPALPRWIFVEGSHNMRDCAFKGSADTCAMRRGLLYRGRKIDLLPPEGIEQLRALGIKTELDLRSESTLTSSPLGEDINYVNIPCGAYGDFFTGEFRGNIKKIFELLADESIYPVYFHCAGGADRTGTLAFMLGAVLGVNYDALVEDYEQIQLDSPSRDMRRTRKKKLKSLKKVIKSANSRRGTIEQRAVSALREAAVSDETMNKIKKILSEENT